MKTRTAVATLLMSTALLQGAANADSVNDTILDTQFRQMAEACQLDIDRAQHNGGQAVALQDCFADKVKVTFLELKNHSVRDHWFYGTYVKIPRRITSSERESFLRAAIESDPLLSLTAFNSALEGRLNVYYATEVASTYLPEQSDNLARIAIARGAPPDRVTAATAAGRRNTRSP